MGEEDGWSKQRASAHQAMRNGDLPEAAKELFNAAGSLIASVRSDLASQGPHHVNDEAGLRQRYTQLHTLLLNASAAHAACGCQTRASHAAVVAWAMSTMCPCPSSTSSSSSDAPAAAAVVPTWRARLALVEALGLQLLSSLQQRADAHRAMGEADRAERRAARERRRSQQQEHAQPHQQPNSEFPQTHAQPEHADSMSGPGTAAGINTYVMCDEESELEADWHLLLAAHYGAPPFGSSQGTAGNEAC